MKPEYVARLHRSICKKARCQYLDKVDYMDSCAACPEGHWGQYNVVECDPPRDPSQVSFFSFRNESPGAGTELKKILAKFGLRPAVGCKCAKHITEMNSKGIDWCEQNIPTITGWLKEEAARAGLPFVDFGAKVLIKRAISNAKKAAKNDQIHHR